MLTEDLDELLQQFLDDHWRDTYLTLVKRRVEEETNPEELTRDILILEKHSGPDCAELAVGAIERLSPPSNHPVKENKSFDYTNSKFDNLIAKLKQSDHWPLTDNQIERLDKVISNGP